MMKTDFEKEKQEHLPYLNAVEWVFNGADYIALNLPLNVREKIYAALKALEMGYYASDIGCDKNRVSVYVPASQPKRRGITLARVKSIVDE